MNIKSISSNYVNKKFKYICKIAISSSVLFSSTSYAALISDIDLNTFDFDVTSFVSSGIGSQMLTSGTSNGVGWSISSTFYWSNRVVTNGTFNYSSLPVPTDNLHPSWDYTITFDQPVSSLLVALSNDNLTDSINFGLMPTDTSGVTFSGTQAILDTARGGLVLFENINSLTISNVNDNGINDGYDLAFHVVSTATVPVPAAFWLFASGLLGLISVSRRKGR